MGRNDYKIDWRGVLFVVCWVVVMTLIVFSMMGCVSQKEYRESVSVDTVYVVKSDVRVDSVWVDRYRNIYVSGDTVHDVFTEYLTKYVFRDRIDTIYKVSVDSVVSEVVVSGDCERSGYDKFCSWWFWISLVVIIVWVVWKVVSRLRRL